MDEFLPKDLINIVNNFAEDTTYLDNYDKVMEQLKLQSCVCEYGIYLTFRKRDFFRSKLFSTIDNFSDWSGGGLFCNPAANVMNVEGKLTIEGMPLYSKSRRPRKRIERKRGGSSISELLRQTHQWLKKPETQAMMKKFEHPRRKLSK